MTRKRFNVVTIAAMIAILAIGSMGLGYAYWTTSLNITTSASAGNASAYLSEVSGGETQEQLYNTQTGQWDEAGYNVPNATCSITINGGDPRYATLTTTGQFPGYSCETHFIVNNNGTVPIVAMPEGPYGVAVSGASGDISTFDVGVHGCDAVIQPGNSLSCHVTIRMPWDATENNTTQGDSVSFTMHPKFKQAVPAS